MPTGIKTIYSLLYAQYIMSFFPQYISPNVNAHGMVFLPDESSMVEPLETT